jgi:uncharacterized protein DUF5615
LTTISRLELVKRLADLHLDSSHVFSLGLDQAQDAVLWEQARQDGYTIEDFMTRQIEHLLAFCTQFIAWAISCSIPIDHHIQVLDEMEKRVIGARWDMDLSRAYWKLATDVMYAYTEVDVERARSLRQQEERRHSVD